MPGIDPIEEAALRYLARRTRTEAQLRTYLERAGASSAQVRRVLRRCRDLGYVNDSEYARRWARNRLARYPIGRERLEGELAAQGVGERTIADVVRDLYDEVTERELAERLLKKKPLTPGQLKRRGFSDETIRAVLKREFDQD